MAMTKSDRKELRTILNGRIDVLRTQVAQRVNEVSEQVRNQIIDENEELLQTYSDEADEIIEEARKLHDRYVDLNRRAEKDGVKLHSRVHGKWFELSYEAPTPTMRDLPGLINKRLAALKVDAGAIQAEMHRVEQELTEELVIGGLETEDARKFLDKIPTIDNLIPLPNGSEQKAVGKGNA